LRSRGSGTVVADASITLAQAFATLTFVARLPAGIFPIADSIVAWVAVAFAKLAPT
jgi:hypothetical protein